VRSLPPPPRFLLLQALALCAAFYAACAADALLRWRRGAASGRDARHEGDALTAALHAAAPLVWGLSLALPLAFYALLWRDAAFQAATVAPKARRRARAGRRCAAAPEQAPASVLTCLFSFLCAQEAAGVPLASWLHEVHAGPALLAALDLAGAKDAWLLRAHTPRPRAVATAALAAAAAALGAAAATAAAPGGGGGLPYAFLEPLSLAERAGAAAAAAATLMLLCLGARAAAARRGAAAVTAAAAAAAPPPPAPAAAAAAGAAAAAAAASPTPAGARAPAARRAKRTQA
jgi:hypothetical protein